jgi:hypothetical protein
MPIPKAYILRVNLPANTRRGVPVQVNISTDPLQPDESYLLRNYLIVIKDIAVTSSPSVDYYLRFVKKDSKIVVETPPVSTLIQSNPSKPNAFSGLPTIPKALGVLPNEKLTIYAIPLADVGASNVPHTAIAFVDEYV